MSLVVVMKVFFSVVAKITLNRMQKADDDDEEEKGNSFYTTLIYWLSALSSRDLG